MPPIPNLKIHIFLEAPYNVCLHYFGYVYEINVVVNASGWQVWARLNFCWKWSKSVWLSVFFWSELGLNLAKFRINDSNGRNYVVLARILKELCFPFQQQLLWYKWFRYINFTFNDGWGGTGKILVHYQNLSRKLVLLHIFNITWRILTYFYPKGPYCSDDNSVC